MVSAETATTLREMMETVVSDEGTAPMAQIPGYRVAGKTGTAERVDERLRLLPRATPRRSSVSHRPTSRPSWSR